MKMKFYKHALLCALLAVFSMGSRAQNLVKNPSFEDYTGPCPAYISNMHPPTAPSPTVSDWYIATESGSSDYFNACAPWNSGVGVPVGGFGYQVARTGVAYVGTYSHNLQGPKEYVEGKLWSPLIAGHRIYVSYWINMYNPIAFVGNLSSVGTENMGAYFSVDSVFIPGSGGMLTVTPQVISPPGQVYSDTLNWELVSGAFTAAGGERWVTLANFAPNSTGTQYYWDYNYYDDVCVLDLDGPPAAVELHDTAICAGTPITIAPPDEMGYYSWDDGSTTRDRVINGAGTYWVKSVDLATCKMKVDTFVVEAGPMPPPVDLGSDTAICRNGTFTLDVYNQGYDTYRWNTGATTPQITVNAPGKYHVTVTSDCYTGSDTILLSYPPVPVASLGRDTVLCKGNPIQLGTAQQGMRYAWNTGSQDCCITVDTSGLYALTLTNACDEKASDEILVTYSGCNNCIMAPNAFSPNNDGLNDRYEVLVNCVMRSFKFRIFNRWGELVFASFKPGLNWDGNYKGQPADAGTYFYELEAVPVMDAVHKVYLKGDITLVR